MWFFTKQVYFEQVKNYLQKAGLENAQRVHVESVKSVDAILEYTSKDYREKQKTNDSTPQVYAFFRLELVPRDTPEGRRDSQLKPLKQLLENHVDYADALLADPDLVGRYTKAAMDYYRLKQESDPRNEVHSYWFYG